MPVAKGKFRKAINRSGAANVVGILPNAVDILKQFLGVPAREPKEADGSRGLTTQQLIRGQKGLATRLRQTEHSATPFQPVIDGTVLGESPMIAIRNGSAKDVPIVADNSLTKQEPSMNRTWISRIWMNRSWRQD